MTAGSSSRVGRLGTVLYCIQCNALSLSACLRAWCCCLPNCRVSVRETHLGKEVGYRSRVEGSAGSRVMHRLAPTGTGRELAGWSEAEQQIRELVRRSMWIESIPS